MSITEISSLKEIWHSEVVSHERVVILFFATWSSPDKMLTHTLTQLVSEFEVIKFLKADVDEIADETDQALIDMFSTWPLLTTPTLMLFKYGEKLESSVGNLREEELRVLLRRWSEL